MNNIFSNKNSALNKMSFPMKHIILGVLFLLLINGVFATDVWTDLSTTDPADWVSTSQINSVFTASDGNVYTGLTDGKFGVYSPATNVWTDLSATDIGNWVGTSSVYSVYGDSNNNIYTGLMDGKFGKLNPSIPSDVNSPTTTLSGCTSGWKNSNQTITLSCTDDILGCNYTTYKLNRNMKKIKKKSLYPMPL